MMIANFTEEAMEWKHGGITGILEPGDLKEFKDSVGNHILNAFSPRGLLRLTFEQANDEAAKPELEEKARRINKEFWIRNITDFNRHNETMKNENKPYVFPPRHIETAAKRMGIPLIGPWKNPEPQEPKPDSMDNSRMNALEEKFDRLESLVVKVMKSVAGEEEANDESVVLKSLYKSLDADQFEEFVKSSISTIDNWPEDVRADIKARWSKDVPGQPCPVQTISI